MSYSVTCPCGVAHSVIATQAGSRIDCACGKPLDIPPLSALRKSVGESPMPLNAVEKIRAMIRDGALPRGEICPYSGRPANDTVFFHVQCEQRWTRGSDALASDSFRAFAALLGGMIGLLLIAIHSRPRELLGHDTFVDVPLRVSADVRQKVLGIQRQGKLKALLRRVPIYAELLAEYPGATITPLQDRVTNF